MDSIPRSIKQMRYEAYVRYRLTDNGANPPGYDCRHVLFRRFRFRR